MKILKHVFARTHRANTGSPNAVSFRYWAALIWALFVALRLTVLLLPVVPTSDAAWYVGRGIEIAAGHGYAEHGVLTAYWPVGYPAFLAALFTIFGPNVFVIKVANLVFGCGTLFLIERLSKAIFSSSRVGLLAMFLYAIYPNQVAYSALALTEIPFTFLLLLGIWVFVRRQSVFTAGLCGLVMGAATLVKTQTVIFPALMLAGYGWTHREHLCPSRFICLCAATYLACFAVILPWSMRNYHVFGTFVLVSTNGGPTLYGGNNQNATGGYISENLVPPNLRPDPANQVAVDKANRAAALVWISGHPRQALSLIPAKIWHLWAPDGEGEWGFEGGYTGYANHIGLFRTLRVINQLYYGALLLLAAGAFTLLLLRMPLPSVWLYLCPIIVLDTTFVSVLFSGQSRFHFPVMPWLIMYGVWFAITCSDRWHSAKVIGSAAET